jgi:hypothetical protein
VKGHVVTRDAPPPKADDIAASGTLVVEEPKFAIVPEWVIDAAISDGAFRLYSLLLRYGNSSGCRMPSRQTLARRLRRSVDAIDRAMRQLTQAGIVRVEHRRSGEQFLSNRYHVRTTAPARSGTVDGGSRKCAATPERGTTGGRISAATPSRVSVARVAADARPNREILTDKPPPPSPSRPGRTSATKAVEEADEALLDACGITDLDALANRCMAARRALGKPTARWTARCLSVVIKLAVVTRGWPAASMEQALVAVAGDRDSRSPARVAEAGPWWDAVILGADQGMDPEELAAMESRLAETDGLRPALQAQARAELTAEGDARDPQHRRATCLRDPRPPGDAMTTTQPDSHRPPSPGIDGGAQPMALTSLNHKWHRCPSLRWTDLAVANVATSNYDAASMQRPTGNKESR